MGDRFGGRGGRMIGGGGRRNEHSFREDRPPMRGGGRPFGRGGSRGGIRGGIRGGSRGGIRGGRGDEPFTSKKERLDKEMNAYWEKGGFKEHGTRNYHPYIYCV